MLAFAWPLLIAESGQIFLKTNNNTGNTNVLVQYQITKGTLLLRKAKIEGL